MNESYFVSPTLEGCETIIDHAVMDSVTGTFLDRYEVSHPAGGRCVVLVYEKHYYRAGNRLTLTVTMDDFTGQTRVHCASGGGGEGRHARARAAATWSRGTGRWGGGRRT